MLISASLVLFNNEPAQFEAAIEAFLSTEGSGDIYVIDNSPLPLVSKIFSNKRVQYKYMGTNIGFGPGHNVAIKEICKYSKYHLILNPDIIFTCDVLTELVKIMHSSNCSALMPRVKYPDGTNQNLCKLLPNPFDLFVRRFVPFQKIKKYVDGKYVISDFPAGRVFSVPTISGCFLVARSDRLLAINGFDERFFMYMEDVDLVRRLANYGEILFVPKVFVQHEYGKGSYKNTKLLLYHIASAVKYFNKWGWFFDDSRVKRNHKCLTELRLSREVN